MLDSTAKELHSLGEGEARPLVYLASPYSHEDPAVMRERYDAITKVAASLMGEGVPAFSPITYSHVLAADYGLPETWDFWGAVDKTYLSCAYALVVVTLEGWEESTGVTAERKWAHHRMPVRFLQPETYELTDDPRRIDAASPRDV